MPREVLTYELTGIPDAPDSRYFTLEELGKLRLSNLYEPKARPVDVISVPDIPYQAIANRSSYEKRLVEHARMLFFAENLVDPLPFGEHGRLGLPYENYKLALTESLLEAVFKDAAGNNKLDQAIDGATTARSKLNHPAISGYLSGADLVLRFAPLPAADLAGQYWIRSGIAGFAPDAAQHFYLPERYTDPFGNVTTLEYDPHRSVRCSPAPTRWAMTPASRSSTFACWRRARCRTSTTTCPKCSSTCSACPPRWR